MRGTLPGILLLAVPVIAGCSSSGTSATSVGQGLFSNSSCTVHTHLTVSVDTPAPPPAQLRIESCRLDVDACMDLCVYELNNLSKYPQWLGGVPPPQGIFNGGVGAPGVPTDGFTPQFTPSLCKVTFDGSTANAEIALDTPNFGPGCAEPGVGVAGGGGGSSGVGGL